MELWDTTGQERFRKVVSQFFRGIHGAIIVFDLSQPKSLETVLYWVGELNNYTSESMPRILFGNKEDLLEAPIKPEFQQ